MGETVYIYNHHRDRKTLTDFTARVNRAFERFQREQLDCTPEVKELLAMQSIQGQAQTGWGIFDGRISKGEFGDCRTLLFPNTTIESVIQALGCNVTKIKKRRQHIINDIFKWIDHSCEEVKRVYSHPRQQSQDVSMKLLNEQGEPLGGICLFSRIEVSNVLNCLRGVYLGSAMDNYENWRKKVEAKFNVKLGGGECYAINQSNLYRSGLSLKDLSSNQYSEKDRKLLQIRGILLPEEQVESSKHIIMAYVRHAEGEGICDDTAMIMAAFLHKIQGKNAFDKDYSNGVLLCDSVDTWDKCTPMIWKGGQDELLGTYVKKKFEELGKYFEDKYKKSGEQMPEKLKGKISLNVSDEEVINFIYAARELPHSPQPDCSQRYFMKIVNTKKKMPVAEQHLNFIDRFPRGYRNPAQRGMERNFKIGVHKMPAGGFYDMLQQRFYKLEEEGIINVA